MLLLTISEVSYWRTTRVDDHLVVDKMQADRDFNIVLDFSFHALACKGACCGVRVGGGAHTEGGLRGAPAGVKAQARARASADGG